MVYRLSHLSKHSFPPLLHGVQHKQDWDHKREKIAAVWKEYIGWMPEAVPTSCIYHAEYVEADQDRKSVV